MDGEEGLRKTGEYRPDIILLDIMMPGMDGWEVLKRLQENGAARDIPVVIFTAKEYSNGSETARKLGAADLIQKPFEPDDLDGVIKKYLK